MNQQPFVNPPGPTTSVTAELDRKDSPLRMIVDDHPALIGKWRDQIVTALEGATSIAPTRPSMGGMVGHAIDYRIRWWLTGVDGYEPAVMRGLAACDERTTRTLLDELAPHLGSPAGPHDPDKELALAWAAVAAAAVEPLARRPGVPCPLQELSWDQFQMAYADVVDDLLAMAVRLPPLLAPYAGRAIVAGPVVGFGRLGGDADLLADDELAEIKCTVRPRDVAAPAVRQMLVYAALLRPQSASLLLPRQGIRVVFDCSTMPKVLDRLDTRIRAAYA